MAIVYLFVPFIYKNQSDFRDIVCAMLKNKKWVCVHDEIKYMLKYVADKIDSGNPNSCQCFHFELKNEAREELGIASDDTWYHTETHLYHDDELSYRFQLKSIQLFCFRTRVGIIAFKIHFESNDPLFISSALYNLKKVSREKIHPYGSKESTTFLSMAKEVMRTLKSEQDFQFFFYANPSTERANILAHIEVEPKDDYKFELFYLRRCYSDGFLYSENKELDEREIYTPSQDIVWGISPEAAVCLTCPERGRADFIQGTFFNNFNTQYLFMYVLLLHQKYVLYMFMVQIGIGTYNSIELLERYRQELYEFETDFVFSCITEVPQYQTLYERMTEAFSLKDMFEDVREPLTSLSEVRRADAEKKQKERDDNVNRSLFLLSLLTFFSALVDSFDFADSFLSWFLGPSIVRVVQIICIAAIIMLLVYVIKNLYFKKK